MSDLDVVQDQTVAWARVDVAGGVPTITEQFCAVAAMTVTDNGAGDFTLNLPASVGVPLNRRDVDVRARSSAFAVYVYDEPNSAVGTVRVKAFDAAGAALDNVPFTVVLKRIAV
jgi:hypothetical protein